MKKNLLLLIGLLLFGMVQTSVAQQRKSARKSAPKKVAPTIPVTVTIDEPVIVNGNVAFQGVPVKQPVAKISQQLKAKGFVDKKENGFQFLSGTAYGVKVKAFVEDENWIAVREVKLYTAKQAKARINAYKKAFLEATGSTDVKNDEMLPAEGGGFVVNTSGGTIDVHYYNEDEVNFDSNYFNIVITFKK